MGPNSSLMQWNIDRAATMPHLRKQFDRQGCLLSSSVLAALTSVDPDTHKRKFQGMMTCTIQHDIPSLPDPIPGGSMGDCGT